MPDQSTSLAVLLLRLSRYDFFLALDMRWTYPWTVYWDVQKNLGHHHQRPLAVAEVENVPDAIRVSYGSWAVDIVRSVDLTVDGLRAEVARLMQCHSSQLMMSDIALPKGAALPKMSDDNALALCATHVNFTCATGADSENDGMDDVQYD